ncbi:MAG: alpha/beta hydrolase-fold protein [Candidatus Krumholzibacteria bacterium]|nr:alpha/beta hydrolase-fold protein [Candidatus Krumholzibacteria bacterium]
MRVELSAPDWATHLLSDLTDWRKAPLPVAELQPFDLPDDAYFEYAWQDAQGEKHPDPDNANPLLNPWWKFASHLTGPAYRPDPWLVGEDVRPQGRVLRLRVPTVHFGAERQVLVYTPAGLAEAELPTIYFQDGKAYYGWGRVCQVLDRMLAAGEVGPAHLVFLTPSQRTVEYAFNDDYLAHMVDEVLPTVEERVRCDGRRTAWGASLGGLCSAHLAWAHPDRFQRVVSQSGAFLFSPDMDFDFPFAGNESFLRQVQQKGPRELAWHLDCGQLEWLTGSNERLAAALAAQGAEVGLVTRNAGHNWVNWRNGLAAGLRFSSPR